MACEGFGSVMMFVVGFFCAGDGTMSCVDKTDGNLDNLDQLACEIEALGQAAVGVGFESFLLEIYDCQTK